MDPSKTPALAAPGWCMRFDRGSMVTLEVSLIVPFDRLRMALEIIEQKRQEGGDVHDR